MERLKSLYSVSEIKILTAASAVGAAFSMAVGGIDDQIRNLIYLVIADYVTGMYAGWKTQTLSSSKGFKGILKKVAIFGAIALCFTIDQAMGVKVLRSAALFGFAVTEGLSILENIDRIGWGEYIPQFIRDKLGQIRQEKGIK